MLKFSIIPEIGLTDHFVAPIILRKHGKIKFDYNTIMTKLLKMNNLIAATGLNQRQIFHCIAMGLIEPAMGSSKRGAYYSENQCATLREIAEWRKTGMSYRAIKYRLDNRNLIKVKQQSGPQEILNYRLTPDLLLRIDGEIIDYCTVDDVDRMAHDLEQMCGDIKKAYAKAHANREKQRPGLETWSLYTIDLGINMEVNRSTDKYLPRREIENQIRNCRGLVEVLKPKGYCNYLNTKILDL